MLVVDGTFEDQIDELATYIDSLTEGESKVQETVQEKLAQGDTESAIRAVVDSSDALLSANEKDFESTHNLLIHILLASQELSAYLPTILSNFQKVPSFTNGATTSYTITNTLFNVSEPQYRLPIFQALLDLCVEHKLYDSITANFRHVTKWLKEWQASPSDSRAVFSKVAALSEATETESRATEFLIRAVETFSPEDESKELTIRAVNASLNEHDRYTVDDLLLLQPVRSLQQTSPAHYDLLTRLSSGSFSDLKEFSASNSSFFSANSISRELVEHKFKVLNVAALAARQDNRKLRYADVASALEIPQTEVEMWIIETIKSGLVEGKLSQPASTFLVHRATYRTFEHEQWEEISAKLASWRESLQGILEVIDNVRNDANGGQQLANGFSDANEDETRSQAPSDVLSVDENAD